MGIRGSAARSASGYSAAVATGQGHIQHHQPRQGRHHLPHSRVIVDI